VSEGGGAEQLRREAAKARKLADNSFNETEHDRLLDVAASLEREATAIDVAMASKVAQRNVLFRNHPAVRETAREQQG
jgi:hypothetical protein